MMQNTDLPLTPRSQTRQLLLGSVPVGGGAPVVIQSMTNTPTHEVAATLQQIRELANAGAKIVRVAVPDTRAGEALQKLQNESPVPLVADIHFDHRLALMAVEANLAGLRINPGNMRATDSAGFACLMDAVREHKTVVRVGVNSGSLAPEILRRFGGPTAEALVESALEAVALVEKHGVESIKVSLKSSSVPVTVEAYRLMARRCHYPLHLGVTEAGNKLRGAIKSAVGLGTLLFDGIGDTLRVSLTADPVEEIPVAQEILRSAGLLPQGEGGVELISCPTCGRTEINLMALVDAVEDFLAKRQLAGLPLPPLKVAVMGCVVNGPGEAKEADIGLAGGRDKGILFKKGRLIRSVNGHEALLKAFLQELETMLSQP